ncbi:LLM class flavin-dependent oxidoreductase [Nonomuraea lactucae]|uniref:LLM class flavin-dependent oxidoreductase n=1 Tax=Nonomuraea lactucae TaxID=2249762 RepID=UPI000DE227F7|nr:LLM class flavin-dependent oxidoreductase [Nonomuraea lactucae]
MSGVDLGLFVPPLHPPERSPAQCWDDDLRLLVHADRLGLAEAWIGEHYCIRWENLPAPELLIAKALGLTERIRLGSGVHVLAHHHPAVMAHKIAALDHLSHGRLMLGIGAGGTPSDFAMTGIDARANEHRRRMAESVEMMLALWGSTEPDTLKGEFWDLTIPAPNRKTGWEYHLRPYQRPHPPIAVAGTSPASGTLRWGAGKGFIPISVDAGAELARSHWSTVLAGAAASGRAASRSDWRIARVVYVAESDDQARSEFLESAMPRAFMDYFRRVLALFGGLAELKHDHAMPDSAIDVSYALDHLWMVGGVATVTDKIRKFYEEVGGFGTLLMSQFDTGPHPGRFLTSMSLMREEVVPRLADLRPAGE